jgi:hypothetical protein
MRRDDIPRERAKRAYATSPPQQNAFILGAHAAFRGGLACDCPYEGIAGGCREAWLKGFMWARNANSVLIGAAT